MGELVDIAFSFPAIIFTVSTLILVCFWAATTLIGGGFDLLDGVDANLEGGAHVELDLELEPGIESSAIESSGIESGDGVNPSDASAGLLRSTLQFLGIIGMPLLLALNLLSLFAWALTMIAVTVIGPSSIGLVIGLVVTVGAFAASGFITGRVAKRYGSAMAPVNALRRSDLVGRFCTITTQRVTDQFGQAEVRDAEGGSLIVQVRVAEAAQLVRGDKALIVDVDNEAGVYHVAAGLEELAD